MQTGTSLHELGGKIKFDIFTFEPVAYTDFVWQQKQFEVVLSIFSKSEESRLVMLKQIRDALTEKVKLLELPRVSPNATA